MMLYDRICARIIPPMSGVEKAETLLKKIPHQDLASTIECVQGDRPEYDGKFGVKEGSAGALWAPGILAIRPLG